MFQILRFSLSCTSVDDIAIAYIGVMPKLKAIDLSHTKVKGTSHGPNHIRLFYLMHLIIANMQTFHKTKQAKILNSLILVCVDILFCQNIPNNCIKEKGKEPLDQIL